MVKIMKEHVTSTDLKGLVQKLIPEGEFISFINFSLTPEEST